MRHPPNIRRAEYEEKPMAAFCGTCGKPVAADGKFCGACGAPNTPAAMATAPAKSGTSVLKVILIILVIGAVGLAALVTGAYFYGRNKLAQWQKDNGVSVASVPPTAAPQDARTSAAGGAALLTKEEVISIIGKPVTEIEMHGKSDASYKTATPGFEAAIEIDHNHDGAGATQAFEAARTVTKRMAGGKGESIPGLGDDALYGAFNVLYVRKNDVVLTITPPNLQYQAQAEAANNMLAQPLGSDAQRQALEKMSQSMKGDPVAGSMSKPDAMSGAVDLIHHSAAESGNEYETKSRLMARQLAEKVLSKL
jgi:hypothetical protein